MSCFVVTIDTPSTTTSFKPYEYPPYEDYIAPPHGVPHPYKYWPPFSYCSWYHHPCGWNGLYGAQNGNQYGNQYGGHQPSYEYQIEPYRPQTPLPR